MYKKLIVFFLSMTGLLLSSCNIFYWVHPLSPSGLDNKQKIEQAQSLMQNGDYGNALNYYENVLESDPNNSQALLGHAQAAMGNVDVNLSSMLSLMPSGASSADTSSGMDTVAVTKTLDMINNLLSATQTMSADLSKIAGGSADGTISESDPVVNSLLAFSEVVNVVTVADSDGDNKISMEELSALMGGGSSADTTSSSDSSIAQKAAEKMDTPIKHFKTAIDNGLAAVNPGMAELANMMSDTALFSSFGQ